MTRNYRLPIPDPQIFNSPRENTLYNVVAQNPDMLGFLVAARGERQQQVGDYLSSLERLARMQDELYRIAEEGERHDADVRALSTIAERPDSAFFLSSIAGRVNPAAVEYMQRVGAPQRMAEINRTAGQAAEAFSAAGLRPPMGSQLDSFGLPIAPRVQETPTSVLAAAAGSGGREPRETTRYDVLGGRMYTELTGPPGTTTAARLDEAPLRAGRAAESPSRATEPSPRAAEPPSPAELREAARTRNVAEAARVARRFIPAPADTPDATMAAAVRMVHDYRMRGDIRVEKTAEGYYILRGTVDGREGRTYRLPNG